MEGNKSRASNTIPIIPEIATAQTIPRASFPPSPHHQTIKYRNKGRERERGGAERETQREEGLALPKLPSLLTSFLSALHD